jgi:hypothetical protein
MSLLFFKKQSNFISELIPVLKRILKSFKIIHNTYYLVFFVQFAIWVMFKIEQSWTEKTNIISKYFISINGYWWRLSWLKLTKLLSMSLGGGLGNPLDGGGMLDYNAESLSVNQSELRLWRVPLSLQDLFYFVFTQAVDKGKDAMPSYPCGNLPCHHTYVVTYHAIISMW